LRPRAKAITLTPTTSKSQRCSRAEPAASNPEKPGAQ
jgi:hypothetical protein